MSTNTSTSSSTGCEVTDAYFGSDGGLTRRLMTDLERRGPKGELAATLFRAQKSSARATAYHGLYHNKYDNQKNEQLEIACELLPNQEYPWGWVLDRAREEYDVLYIDLPVGQVSFRCANSWLRGPDYMGQWDETQSTERNVIAFLRHVREFIPPSATPRRARGQRPRQTFLCAHCQIQERPRLRKPKDWRVLFHNGEVHLLCRQTCFETMRDRLDRAVFNASWTFPYGDHQGERLQNVPGDYLSFVFHNAVSRKSVLWQAARAEQQRRFATERRLIEQDWLEEDF